MFSRGSKFNKPSAGSQPTKPTSTATSPPTTVTKHSKTTTLFPSAKFPIKQPSFLDHRNQQKQPTPPTGASSSQTATTTALNALKNSNGKRMLKDESVVEPSSVKTINNKKEFTSSKTAKSNENRPKSGTTEDVATLPPIFEDKEPEVIKPIKKARMSEKNINKSVIDNDNRLISLTIPTTIEELVKAEPEPIIEEQTTKNPIKVPNKTKSDPIYTPSIIEEVSITKKDSIVLKKISKSTKIADKIDKHNNVDKPAKVVQSTASSATIISTSTKTQIQPGVNTLTKTKKSKKENSKKSKEESSKKSRVLSNVSLPDLQESPILQATPNTFNHLDITVGGDGDDDECLFDLPAPVLVKHTEMFSQEVNINTDNDDDIFLRNHSNQITFTTPTVPTIPNDPAGFPQLFVANPNVPTTSTSAQPSELLNPYDTFTPAFPVAGTPSIGGVSPLPTQSSTFQYNNNMSLFQLLQTKRKEPTRRTRNQPQTEDNTLSDTTTTPTSTAQFDATLDSTSLMDTTMMSLFDPSHTTTPTSPPQVIAGPTFHLVDGEIRMDTESLFVPQQEEQLIICSQRPVQHVTSLSFKKKSVKSQSYSQSSNVWTPQELKTLHQLLATPVIGHNALLMQPHFTNKTLTQIKARILLEDSLQPVMVNRFLDQKKGVDTQQYAQRVAQMEIVPPNRRTANQQ